MMWQRKAEIIRGIEMAEIETDETETHHFDVRTHNGTITIRNTNTGGHRTFRITTQPSGANFAPGKRIVSLLTDGDEWRSFGFVFENTGVVVWRSKRGGTFDILADMINRPSAWEPKGAEYMYEGRCRRCNRPLTNPESIESGIGPICAGKD